MISPLNSTTLYSKNLEPVKVPHFCANKQEPNIQNEAQNINSSVSFKNKAQKVLDATKYGAKKGLGALKKGCLFVKDVTVSAFKDLKEIVIKRHSDKISKANDVAEKVV